MACGHPVRAGSKDLRALMRKLPKGVLLVSDGKSKGNLMRDGSLIRYPDGRPVSVPNSPSPASVKSLVARLGKLGLL